MLLNHLLGQTQTISEKTRQSKNHDTDNAFDELGIDRDYDIKALFGFSRKQLRPWLPAKVEYSKGVAYPRTTAHRLHLFLTDPNESKLGERAIQFVFLVILISCVSFIIQTLPHFQTFKEGCEVCKPVIGNDLNNPQLVADRLEHADICKKNNCEPGIPDYFNVIEAVCVAIFTLDYLIRVLTAYSVRSSGEISVSPTYVYPRFCYLRRTVSYLLEWLNLVDLVAIVPFYVQLGISRSGVSLSVVRVLRLLRIVRMFRFGHFSSGMLMFLQVIRTSMMAFFIIIVFTLFGMIVFGSLIYYTEKGEWDPATGLYLRPALYYLDPDQPSPYSSIPTSFWWVFVTFATVGFGDMFPTTAGGRFIGVLCMYTGVLFISMPITVVGANFADAYLEQQRKFEHQKHLNQVRAKILHHLLFMRRLQSFRKAWNAWSTFTQQAKHEETDVATIVRRVVREIVAREMSVLRSDTVTKISAIQEQLKNEIATLKD